jgi:thioredoxin reductase
VAGVDERPFPRGDYDVVVVGSGPGGLQAAYSLARTGIERVAVLTRDDAPGGMFRRFPVYQRLISWTRPEAPFAHGTREYEWYDHNSLVGVEPAHRALMPSFMDRTMDLPTRAEMEAALVEFAERGAVRVRYGCEWQATRREGERLVLTTSDGDYGCRVAVFALGVTEPWRPSIPGLEDAPHYVETRSPERYAGKRVLIVGKRNSGFEVAHGLLPWAREITLVSPRPVETAVLAFSPLRVRYLQPYEEHARGGAGTFVLDAALDRVERTDGVYRVRASGTSRPGTLELEADELVLATGFRTPLRDLPELGVATVDEGRLPAQTPYWESVSAPGVYFAGNATQASPGLRKYGASSSSTAVNGFRYNARLLARRIAERHFGIARERPRLPRERVLPFLLAELARAPELWIQKGYLARVVTFDGDARDEGILPLEDFVDSSGPDAVAVAIELDAQATIVPVVYVRRGGRVAEHVLAPHPLYAFDGDEHRRELEARLRPLLG